MATLALSAVGSAAGSYLLPEGLSVFGSTIAGAAIGSQIGALGGHVIDQALFGASGRQRLSDGPRLSDLRVLTSAEGAPVPRLYGSARLGGQVIWACNLTETVVPRASRSAGGGKGGAGGSSNGVTYNYFADFAVGLCEGPISGIGSVWADGNLLDLTLFTTRLYDGSEAQTADAYIEAKQASASTPAYRGLAYIVFEQMPLAAFGNRIPQLSFEIFRPIDGLAQQIRGVALIPGSGEFVYAPTVISRSVGRISTASENVHTLLGGTDWSAALDQLQSSLPNARSVSLVVSWFGTSLDAAQCQLRPGVEDSSKVTAPQAWSVSGLTRATAPVVSQINGRAAFGGTPSDQSVVDAIRDLKARGLSPVLSPFILLDIPAGNTLPDPYSSSPSQGAYPWRGRITVSPASGRAGSPDKTSAAGAAVARFVGSAQPGDFALNGDSVTYSGPAEFSFRRMILHYAMLARAAGGVDAFVLCSELRGLTQTRSDASTYPFVAALAQLAADVRSILGPAAKIVYAADWTEYFGHHPTDGSGDVYFHLDPLWSSAAIDAIGIDCYWPLSDWRDGDTHLDVLAGAPSIYDQKYLRSNLTAGEGYAWYYATSADRVAQARTPITDGADKPWVFRFKDLRSWWSSPHFNRPGGVEVSTPTAWVAQSKPVWFMELGCPAVDKGANQPNVFVDPKSSESTFPYFSSQARDDSAQRSYLQAFHDAFNPAFSAAAAALNPISAIYNAPMLDLSRLHVYCWDARPYPAFPADTQVWGDGANWELGHWICGRIASTPLAGLLQRILSDFGFAAGDASAITGVLPGFVIDRIMSVRDALQPLELAFFFDSIESGGSVVFRHRANSATGIAFGLSDLVENKPDAALATVTRAQETDLPMAAKIAYIANTSVASQAIAESRRIAGGSHRISMATLPLVLDSTAAGAIAETWLFETWAAREKATFSLPPSQLALEPGDTVTLNTGARSYRVRITDVGDHGTRDLQALSIDLDIYSPVPAQARPNPSPTPIPAGPPLVAFLDIPTLNATDPDYSGYVATAKAPWPGTMAVWRSPDIAGYTLDALAPTPATTGLTVTPLAPGPTWRPDLANTVTVDIDAGTLTSVTRLQWLAGANLAAVERTPNVWEVLQFQSATLVAPGRYQLATLLRGQRGTDTLAMPIIPAGSRFVLLDGAVVPVAMSADDVAIPYNWKVGPASRDIGDASYLTAAHTFTGAGLLPLRPVQVRASRSAAGDLTVTWLRRTRTDGDNWEPADVPLGEASESYRVEVLASAPAGTSPVVVRTSVASSASFVYSAAQQSADFGSPMAQITLRLAQISLAMGAGTTTLVTV